jgi:hypothetical membrane protein
MNHRQWAGLALFAGGAQFFLGLLIAETLYPGYSVALNYISDLGVGPEPSRAIFSASVFLFGLLGLTAAVLLIRSPGDRVVPYMLLASGLGAMGVGLINEHITPYHTLVAFLAFFMGGLVAVFSYRLVGWPLGFLSLVLGLIGLAALVLIGTGTNLGMGKGGIERMVLYPSLTWIIGLGAVLVGQKGETGPQDRV